MSVETQAGSGGSAAKRKRISLLRKIVADALPGNYSGERTVNVGTGDDLTIRDLAGMIAWTVGFTGGLMSDSFKREGVPRKLLDVSTLHRVTVSTPSAWRRGSPPPTSGSWAMRTRRVASWRNRVSMNATTNPPNRPILEGRPRTRHGLTL